MILTYALAKTGHPNCRRPDKVIDAAQTDVKSPSDARLVAEKIIDSLGQPFLIAGKQQNVVSGSVGISIYPTDGLEMDVLIKHADEAMYEAKESGKNAYRFYSC